MISLVVLTFLGGSSVKSGMENISNKYYKITCVKSIFKLSIRIFTWAYTFSELELPQSFYHVKREGDNGSELDIWKKKLISVKFSDHLFWLNFTIPANAPPTKLCEIVISGEGRNFLYVS